ncbi:hypothetical protein PRIPAC_71791 [Pristionchus pacificus]|uniref:Uncharacterized protein n=1 Tax=Pristionchus pacificus TaxID=54126 RepID=A0A2A6C624_PRIPA|nr:hypothetical protein PRIPAC_71791 [Pristionchus pacificus]|eukprot:PDM73599.1 hypothetical protein PRIPAC_40955 [Pristionchus pacificus]
MSGLLSGQDRCWMSEEEENEVDEYLAKLPPTSRDETKEVIMYVMIGLMPLLALYIDVHFKKWAGLDFDLILNFTMGDSWAVTVDALNGFGVLVLIVSGIMGVIIGGAVIHDSLFVYNGKSGSDDKCPVWTQTARDATARLIGWLDISGTVPKERQD